MIVNIPLTVQIVFMCNHCLQQNEREIKCHNTKENTCAKFNHVSCFNFQFIV